MSRTGRPRKHNRLAQQPEVQEKVQEAIELAKKRKDDKAFRSLESGEGMRAALRDPDVRKVLEDILESSTIIPEPQKEYIRNYFYHGWNLKQAFEITRGRAPTSDAEARREGKSIMESPPVKEFLEVIRMFYVGVLPITATKKMEMLFDPTTKGGVKLEIIKDIEEKAGVTGQQKAVALPYNVTINVPVQQNTQVNNNGGENK